MNRILVALAVGTGIAIGTAAIFTLVTERSTDARSADFEFDTGSPARERGAAASAAAVSTDDRAAANRRAAAASKCPPKTTPAAAARRSREGGAFRFVVVGTRWPPRPGRRTNDALPRA